MIPDLKLALRTLRRTPVVTVVVVLTLALGIGANTAIFSVVNGILLRPLPFPEPDELVAVWADFSRRGGPEREWLSYPNFADLRDETTTLEGLGVYQGWGPTLTGGDEAERLLGARVSAGMLSGVLAVEPALGRGLGPDEARPEAPGVVLLSHRLWTRRFGQDAAALGASVTLDGEPYTVVGIMPEGFRPPFVPDAELWAPLRMTVATSCGRACVNLRAVGRIADGVDVEAARQELATLSGRLESEYPNANRGVGHYPVPLRQDLVGQASTPLWILLGAVGFVLLIACVNVANLLLARGAAREGQVAVRAALGASRTRIVREVLVESLVLAAGGGAAGLLLAFWGTDLLVAGAPAGIPRIDEVVVAPGVLVFTAAVALGAGVLFGILPALSASRTDVHGALAGAGRDGGEDPGGRRTRRSLVVVQVGLALVLLVGAGLLLRTLRSLDAVDLGYEPAGVLTLSLNLPSSRYRDGAERTAFYSRLQERVARIPGVESAGAVSALPLSGFNSDTDFRIEGRSVDPDGPPQVVWYRPLTPGYFESMGIDVARGRGVRPGDDAEAPPVVVINESLASRYFAGQDPLGHRLAPGGGAEPTWYEIVGVAENVKSFGIREEEPPAIYVPHAQIPFTSMFLAVRTAGDPGTLVAPVRRALAELDPELAASRVEPMTSVVRGSLARERFAATLLALFASLALALAAVGIYGVVSYAVSRRRREMGIRLAVGAEPRALARLVLRDGLFLAGAGVVLGVAGALLLTRFVEGLLFGVPATDPVTFGAVAGVLVLVAAAASWIPARRASRVEPAEVLTRE